jgi:glutamate-1-semialdehyde 2,1-aminomutase
MYPDLNSRSAQLYERAKHVLPGGNSRTTIDLKPHPIYVTHAEGSKVHDVDGNIYIDFINNYTSLIHGHAYPGVTEVVTEQLSKGTAYSFGTEQEIAHAELICGRVPGFDKIRFMNSGSEAVMNAIKAARAFTGRPKIAKCEGAYHGSYDFAEVSLNSGPDDWGQNDPQAIPYSKGTPQGVLDDVVVIPYHDEVAAAELLKGSAGDLAAVVYDPVASRVGMIPPSDDYLEMLVDFCQTHGVLLVFDEVIAFRLGYEGAQGMRGVTPDLTALGKIIGGGFPVGAVAGRDAAMQVFEGGGGLPHGGTFNGNPVTMLAGMATMEGMTRQAFDELNALGDFAREGFREAFGSAGVTGQVTGQGSLMRLHLTDRPLTNYRTVYPMTEESARMNVVHRHLLNAGYYQATYGLICLSTVNTREEVEGLIAAAVEGIQAAESAL